MKKVVFIAVSFVVLLSSCNTDKKEAKAQLEQARQLYEQKDWSAAKTAIDSLRLQYPKQIAVLREGLDLMREIEVSEAERTIIYCDSLIPIRSEEAEKLKEGFLFEKDSLYDTIGKYIWKQQTIERNIERCYIRSGVDEKGEIYIASVFYGNRPINHTSLRVSIPDGAFAETTHIPYDGGVNYRFEDEGNTTEVVTYKGEKGLEAITFIHENQDSRIKAEFMGGKPYIIYMADGDKKAISATYELAVVLNDMDNLITERAKAVKKLGYLKSKLEKE